MREGYFLKINLIITYTDNETIYRIVDIINKICLTSYFSSFAISYAFNIKRIQEKTKKNSPANRKYFDFFI